ncbi:MAG TPA: small multi-drug export protein [Candidatus Thermoplasmatota archaeon]|nr:small multi-drug export protein [Candidatus Thermoplasmatota archaeon]
MAVPGWLVVLAVAFAPELESRASIPLALLAYRMPLAEALGLTLLGNLAGAALAWRLLPVLARWMRRVPALARALEWLLRHTRRRAGGKAGVLEAVGLLLFIGVPLPGTGAWAGVAAARLFGVPGRKAFWPVVGGTVLAAVLVALLVQAGRIVP